MKTRNKLHIIGIAGSGMSALAVLFKDAGFEVTGSDENIFSPTPEYLRKNKISFAEKFSPSNIPEDVDLVVVGKNVHLAPEVNPETRAAIDSGAKIKSLPEALTMLSRGTENIVVAGSFGKSSVAALLAWVLKEAGQDPSYFIGAIPVDLSSSHLGKGKEFIIEGDEYPSSNWDSQSKFLHLNPSSVLLTSGEHDHVNVFPTEKSYIEPYKKLVSNIPKHGTLVFALSGKNNKEIVKQANCKKISYSLNNKSADWCGQNFKWGLVTSFDLMNHGKKVTVIKTKLLGKHDMENITGAGAMLLQNRRVTPSEFADSIFKWSGIKRRMELLNPKSKIPVYEGFGSSYEKARAVFDALKLHFPKQRVVAVFEPHAFSWRNKKFLKWYKGVFKGVSEVIMLPETSHGKKSPGQLNTKQIWAEAKKHFPIHTAMNEKETLEILKKIVKKGDIVALVSSGSLFGLSKSVPKLF